MATRTPETPAPERALRADARRNRERVLAAARDCFARQGLETQMDDVAGQAGVGVGTVYRHFPTKEALLEALADERFATLAEWAREALAAPEPWDAFCDYMRRSAALQADDLALSQAMAALPGLMSSAAERAEMPELMQKLVARAQRSGELRPDAEWEDVPMMICGLGRVTEPATGPASFMSWERMLEIMLDGMRAPGSGSLPPRH